MCGGEEEGGGGNVTEAILFLLIAFLPSSSFHVWDVLCFVSLLVAFSVYLI